MRIGRLEQVAAEGGTERWLDAGTLDAKDEGGGGRRLAIDDSANSFCYENMPDGRIFNILGWALTSVVYAICAPVDGISGIAHVLRGCVGVPEDATWCIVMGCGYRVNGGAMLKSRCALAARLRNTHPEMRFILSGTHREGYSETRFMRSTMVDLGVSEDRLILDPSGYCTLRTFEGCRSMVDGKVVIATSDFHAKRCVYTARRLGFDAYGIPQKRNTALIRWRYWLREKACLYRAALQLTRIHRAPVLPDGKGAAHRS